MIWTLNYQTLALLDSQLNNLDKIEKKVSDLSVRMPSGIGVKYGYDINEHEMAGGTRKSERANTTKNQDTIDPFNFYLRQGDSI